jgi:hypothetical protein
VHSLTINHHDPRVAAMYRRLAGQKSPTKGATKRAQGVSTGKSASPLKSPFAHLIAAPPDPDRDTAPVTATRSMSKAAAAILAAAERARSPTGAPDATGVAAQIIAAGKRRRGEA